MPTHCNETASVVCAQDELQAGRFRNHDIPPRRDRRSVAKKSDAEQTLGHTTLEQRKTKSEQMQIHDKYRGPATEERKD